MDRCNPLDDYIFISFSSLKQGSKTTSYTDVTIIDASDNFYAF